MTEVHRLVLLSTMCILFNHCIINDHYYCTNPERERERERERESCNKTITGKYLLATLVTL